MRPARFTPSRWKKSANPPTSTNYAGCLLTRPTRCQTRSRSRAEKRTLTNLYNARPAWLDNAHRTLDAAVAEAYGWHDYTPEMVDEEILRRLLVLNLARTG
jgi:hypothetical protein